MASIDERHRLYERLNATARHLSDSSLEAIVLLADSMTEQEERIRSLEHRMNALED